jgi:hypothetical protein
MSVFKNNKRTQAREPLAYEEACRRYAEWSERESAEQGVIPLGIPQPNRGLSEVVGTTWHLENVSGPLAKVGSNGRVWGPRREGN